MPDPLMRAAAARIVSSTFVPKASMTSQPISGARFSPAEANAHKRALHAIVAEHQTPLLGQALLQVVTSFVPFFGLIAAMYALWDISPWLSLALTIPTAGFLVRIFIIQHDCGHDCFFPNRAANDWLGRFCGLVTMTPYANWRRRHATHHATWNNLDRRTSGGDIYSTCMTVAEYQALPLRWRLWHRAVRHPLVAQLLLPPFIFLLYYRLPMDTPASWRRERASVLLTNAGLIAKFALLMLLLGAGRVALVQLPIIAVTAIIGVWLFSIQHRFEGAVWSRQNSWSATEAALLGSSHLNLPRILQWFSGNIGFHHIHHLAPRVPNYRLEECHRACAAIVPAGRSLSLLQALRAPAYTLWDEEKGGMARFADLGRAGTSHQPG